MTEKDSGIGGLVENKVLIGDKYGQVQLFDASRKLMLDKKVLYEAPRSVISISTATVVWVDTRLTYVAVVARANPIVKILVFKHNENKLYHIYNVNTCPALANPDALDSNPEQSYLDLPSEAKLSYDVAFLAVTTFGGEVKVLKMPAIINPVRDSDDSAPVAAAQAAPPGKGVPPPVAQAPTATGGEEKPIVLKPDIDSIPLTNLDINTITISKIEAKKESRFKDPYVYNPNQDEEGGAVQADEPPKPVFGTPQPTLKFALGMPVKDTNGGDAGLYPKRSRFYPTVNFIRSKYCSSQNAPSTVDPNNTNRTVKEYYVTTGLVLAYSNSFDVVVYNLQKPSKDAVIPDYSSDYYNKIIA